VVGTARRVETAGRLEPGLVARVFELVEAAAEADDVRPLSEHVTLHLRHGGEAPDVHLLAFDDDGEIAGYAHVDPTDAVAGASVELVVHPAARRRGHATALVQAALEATPDGRLRLWAHGDSPAARALAARLGLHVGRRLEQWRRSLFSPLPRLELPDGVRLRAFRPGADDAEWLALNARAFAGHPEQGAWTEADLRARMAEDWFDPEGFLLAEEDGPAGPRLVAFHWTKVHGADGHGHDPIGEVYVVGVDPAAQGRGLGRAVTLAGLHRLRALALPQAMLYVEGDNEPAKATYRRLGFSHWDTDVMFYRGPA
jgi:mycothiol synthase